MLSAFGVDHGDISKGFKLPGMGGLRSAKRAKNTVSTVSHENPFDKPHTGPPLKLGIPKDTPAQARGARLDAARAHESAMGAPKPMGFRDPNRGKVKLKNNPDLGPKDYQTNRGRRTPSMMHPGSGDYRYGG